MTRPLLRLLGSRRFWRFAAVGASGVFVNLGTLALFAEVAGLSDILSSALAIEVSIGWNFALNNAWTFKDRNDTARAGAARRFAYYNLISLVGMAVQLGTFVIMNSVFVAALGLAEPGAWKYLSQLAGIAVATGWNFFVNLHFTWAQLPGAAPRGAPPASLDRESAA